MAEVPVDKAVVFSHLGVVVDYKGVRVLKPGGEVENSRILEELDKTVEFVGFQGQPLGLEKCEQRPFLFSILEFGESASVDEL
jgi:hypothetical protein